MAWAPPQHIGDTAPVVSLAKAKLKKFSYGKELDTGPVYTANLAAALVTFAINRNKEIDRNHKPGPRVNQTGVLDWAMQKQLGLIVSEPTAPPAPAARHKALVFRGTGGVIGHDYVSAVCQHAGTVDEINPDFPASMGGLPPGAPGAPSARVAINTGYESACRWIESSSWSFLLGGYSLGDIVAGMLLDALHTPGGRLYEHRDRFVASFHFGPPSRPEGGAFFNGTPAPGVGISSWRVPQALAKDPRMCWLAHPGDMYASIPKPIEGGTGDIMETVFDMVTDLQLSDFIGTVKKMIPHLLEILNDSGVLPKLLPGAASLLTLNPVAALTAILPLLTAAMPGLIAGIGNPGAGGLTGPAASAQAAIIGIKFLLTGTRDHINYHTAEVWPGQTYFDLAVQHVRHWSAAVPVLV